MPEEFLQYIWEQQLFYAEGLKTPAGQEIEILDVGRRNYDSGPDFFNAKIKIDGTTWAGNVEIHKKSSDWFSHKHQNDKAYGNVVLHIVEENDRPAFRASGEEIPTLEMKYPKHLRDNYQKLLGAKTWIACEYKFKKIDPVVLQLGFNRLMVERLESKTGDIMQRLAQNKNNWQETFYQMLSRMLGFGANKLPFEMLAKSLPLKILSKHKTDLFQLEALLFGNSGLLNQQLLGDGYFLKLREEYSFLYKKYKLSPIEGHLWKFMRLRPANFPTVRISQLAALVHRSNGLFSKIIDTGQLGALKRLFDVQASGYWDSHYNFNKTSSKATVKKLGDNSINVIVINVVIPFLFVYGEIQNKPQLKNRALDFLEGLPPEKNSIIKNWQGLGIEARSAFESQALIQLKNIYCETKNCLNCQIGVKLVKSKTE